MKDLTIYNVYVEMESQEQCDRMKKLCIDNNLPYSTEYESFYFDEEFGNEFYFTHDTSENNLSKSFTVLFSSEHDAKVTEEQFIELLKKHKND